MSREFIPFFALMIPMIIVPTALFFKHLGASREMAHKERMRAIEVGYPLTNPGASGPSVAALMIGGVVPSAAFLFAFVTNVTTNGHHEEAWAAAALVGLVGVLAGAKLVSQILAKPRETAWPTPPVENKPSFDPDAYDTVSRRG